MTVFGLFPCEVWFLIHVRVSRLVTLSRSTGQEGVETERKEHAVQSRPGVGVKVKPLCRRQARLGVWHSVQRPGGSERGRELRRRREVKVVPSLT